MQTDAFVQATICLGNGPVKRGHAKNDYTENVFMAKPESERIVRINNPQGLHARPADLFARLAMQFDSNIEVIRDGYRVDAKSTLDLLTLGAGHGSELTLRANGPDAEESLEALVRLIDSDFAKDGTLSQDSAG